MRDGKPKLVRDMEKSAAGAIIRAGQTYSKSFMIELESYRKSFDEMIENLNDETFNLECEQQRTTKILEEMVRRISHISELTTGKTLSEQGVIYMAER